MPRVKRGVIARAAHKKVLNAAKGFRGRRNKKRDFRALWITRINAAVREHGMTYSVFMNGLKKAEIAVDRKVLADIAVLVKAAFAKFVERARASLGAGA